MRFYKVNGEEVRVYKIKNDANGNPRYCIHFLALGLTSFASTNKTRQADLGKYTGKKFSGCFTFSTYGDIGEYLEQVIKILHS